MNNQNNTHIEVEGLHHYTLSVSDIDRSIEWYSGKLNFKLSEGILVEAKQRTAYLRNRGVMLKLVQSPEALPLPPYRSLPNTDNAVRGHKHFSLLVKDGALAEKHLKALGVPVVFTAIVDDTYGSFICDPTGNLIEILQEKIPENSFAGNQVSDAVPVAIDGWSHAAISVPDADESVAWYTAKLSLNYMHTHQSSAPGRPRFKIVWLRAPDFCLEIFEVAGSAPLPSGRLDPASDLLTLGNKYFSLAVADLKEVRRRLGSLDIVVLSEVSGPTSGLFIRDNSGLLIEFVESAPHR
jgi:catechol 2,3-dioxygenase-like lactoylglutathione lyase family enzyme